ncbi:MAG: biotin carboxylase [Granulosicoccus sp.]|nr:biotin carboxylase [Granulosicoccus sp.]
MPDVNHEPTRNGRRKLQGLSEIFTFLRKNQKPIYVVTPTPFSLLGLEQWVGGVEFINYFDIFDGHHPRSFVPTPMAHEDFQSMEDVANYLVSHPEFRQRVSDDHGGMALFVMFNEETEKRCKEAGVSIALAPAALRERLDSKIVTTQLGNEAGVLSAPNVLGEADTYTQLNELASGSGLGSDLVVQTPYGDSGRTTFFISSENDWNRYSAKIIGQKLKVMKRINHLPGTVEGCATRHGTLVGPVMTDITGFEEITPYKGGWCGNDIAPGILPEGVPAKVQDMVKSFGERLYAEGYKGVFCLDFLLDTDTNDVYLGELNPRISGATPPTNLVTATYGGCPLFLFHLLEYMDVDYEVDIADIQHRWTDYDHWTQLIFKQTEDKVELITRAPQSGIWQMDADGEVSFVRPALNITSVGQEDEAFYLRVYGNGDYCYHGADLGCLLTRGRMQTDKRELTERAKLWNTGIKKQFTSVPLQPDLEINLPDNFAEGKWF